MGSAALGSTGEVRDLTEDIRLDRYFQHTIEVVVDASSANPASNAGSRTRSRRR